MPDETLTTVFDVRGHEKVIRAYERIAASAQRAASAAAGGPALPSGSGLVPARAGGRSSGFASGPNQRLAELHRQLPRALAQGNLNAVRDIHLGIERAQKAIARSAGPSVGSRLSGLIRSTRIGVGGGGGLEVMPLIGRLMEVAGAAGPIGEAAVAAVAVTAAMLALAQSVAATSRSFTDLQNSLGSGGGTAARLGTLGAAIGLSPQAVAGMSRDFQGAITSDPFAQQAALRAGVFNLPAPFGHVDQGQDLLKAVMYLRTLTGDEQIRQARLMHLEAALPLTKLSNGTLNNLQSDAGVQSQIFNPKMQQDALEFQASLSRLGTAFQNLLGALGHDTMNGLTVIINGIANALEKLAHFLNSHPTLTRMVFGGVISDIGAIHDTLKGHNDALADNTKATRENTNMMRPGRYGLGERGNAAIPDAYKGNGAYLGAALQTGALQLGAF